MKVIKTKLEDCLIFEPDVFCDSRGYFFESFNQEKFNKLTNLDVKFVQDNESFSTKGVLRGLHYQIGEFAQAKLVRVINGKILDVVVDLRKKSSTYGKYLATELSSENKRQMYIPRGFAHGFIVLSETAIFLYKCDNYYNKSAERGILFNDKNLNINWQLPFKDLIISEKDLALPKLENAEI
jgi:dTDP-4-dehydrorhamnose 3,5-epimerase